MESTAIVLHGPTSAGKSSLARALQASATTPAFHVSLDAFVTMSNRRDMRNDDERDRAYRLHCENLRSTLKGIAGTGFDLILDLVLRDTAQLDETLRVLDGRPTYVIGVFAPLHVLEERERSRDDRGNGMAREQFGHPAYDRAYDLTIDTSTCSAEAGAARIRSFISERPHLAGQSKPAP